jgi:putative ABC transport system substrate-binding protein
MGMRRRDFIQVIVGGAMVVPFVARAQERIRRIGVLTGYLEQNHDAQARGAALIRGLHALGWVEGRNIQVIYRHAGPDQDRLKEAARALVASGPDVIVVQSNPAVIALREVDRTIPAVFVQVGDPVGSGFVKGLSRPGGNLTGFSTSDPDMGGKWLELLKEIAPATNRVVAILDPKITGNVNYLPSAEAAALIHKTLFSTASIRDAADIEPVLSAFAATSLGALMVFPSPLTAANRVQITRLTIAHLIPSIWAFRNYAEGGGLLSYGPDPMDLFSRAAPYVDRILRGDNPADLPVQAPTKFELVINVKTAKALRLTVPSSLLARADDVIE